MSRTGASCSWCHEMVWNDSAGWPLCWNCGHDASVPRMFCHCRKCCPAPLLVVDSEKLPFQSVRCPYCECFFPAEHQERCTGKEYGLEDPN